MDGKFCVRKRAEGGHVLCVVFRGKPTHHLIAADPDGTLKCNKKSYGSNTTDLNEVCDTGNVHHLFIFLLLLFNAHLPLLHLTMPMYEARFVH